MRKLFSLFFLVTLFISFSCQAVRTNPRVGRPVWTMIRQATPQPIEAADAVGGTITIDQAGNYELYEDIENINIIISSELVSLDLNGYQITYNDKDQDIITIDANQVAISGGLIKNSDVTTPKTGSGILINPGISDIFIDRLAILDCGNGIFLDGRISGTTVDPVFGCFLIGLDLVGNNIGVKLDRAKENTFVDCICNNGTKAGFDLFESTNNTFDGCQTLNTVSETSAEAFKSHNGLGNIFRNCVAETTRAGSGDFGTVSNGFLFTGTENRSKIIDCVVDGVSLILDDDSVSTGSAVTYGIHLESILPELLEETLVQITTADSGTVENTSAIAWSPDNRYIIGSAYRSNEGVYRLQVYGYDDVSVTQLDFISYGLDEISSVDWSPDGIHVVSGTSTTSMVHTFSFDGTDLYFTATLQLNYGVTKVAWSPNGHYIAATTTDGITSDLGSQSWLYILKYDGKDNLVEVDKEVIRSSFETPPGPSERDVVSPAYSVDWSPDGRYIVVGTKGVTNDDDTSRDSRTLVQVFSFDGRTSRKQTTELIEPFSTIASVKWSPHGRYVLVGESNVGGAASGSLRILEFNGFDLVPVDIETQFAGTGLGEISGVTWAPNGKSFACSDKDGYAHLYTFNGELISHLKTATILSANDIDWSPGGRDLVCSTDGIGNDYSLIFFDVMNNPQRCMIINNTVCGIAAYSVLAATGIAGGGSNCFLKNISCNNKVDFTFGIPNVFYGDHIRQRPFDNYPTQRTNLLMGGFSLSAGWGGGRDVDMAMA